MLRWIDGDVPVEGKLAAPDLLATDLAVFLRVLWKVDLADGIPADGESRYPPFTSSPSELSTTCAE